MKKIIFTILFCSTFSALFSQNKTHKNIINAGFGFQQYNGDLGNTFFTTDQEWYGVGRLSYNRYLNASWNVTAFATLGDFGHCFDGEQDPQHPVLNMRSRLNTLGVGFMYKFANGYILPETFKVAPYVYAGAAINSVRDIWSHGTRVNNGNYSTLNYGLGATFLLYKNLQLTYNMGFGYFTSDAMDYIVSGKNDMYMQNTLSLGVVF